MSDGDQAGPTKVVRVYAADHAALIRRQVTESANAGRPLNMAEIIHRLIAGTGGGS